MSRQVERADTQPLAREVGPLHHDVEPTCRRTGIGRDLDNQRALEAECG